MDPKLCQLSHLQQVKKTQLRSILSAIWFLSLFDLSLTAPTSSAKRFIGVKKISHTQVCTQGRVEGLQYQKIIIGPSTYENS